MSSVLLGTSLILWILTVFLILQIYKVNQTLDSLLDATNRNMGMYSNLSPGNYEIRDSEGNLVYTIEMKDQGDMMDMDGMPMEHDMDPAAMPEEAPATDDEAGE